MFEFKATNRFDKAVKKLAKGNAPIASKIVDAMDAIRTNPYIGDLKHGDLKGIRCYDFTCKNRIMINPDKTEE